MRPSDSAETVEHREVPLSSYPERRRVEALTEANLELVLASRRVLMAQGGHYGKKMAAGGYGGDSHSAWQLFAVSGLDNSIATVVFWKEVDDGRFSFHFAPAERHPRFFCYEN